MELPINPPATPPTAAPTKLWDASPPTNAPEPAPSAVSVEASLLQAADDEIVPAQSAKAAAAENFAKRFMSESPVIRRRRQADVHCRIDNEPLQANVPHNRKA